MEHPAPAKVTTYVTAPVPEPPEVASATKAVGEVTVWEARLRVAWVAFVILKAPVVSPAVDTKLPDAAQVIDEPEYDPTLVPLTVVGVGAPPPEHVIALEIAEPV